MSIESVIENICKIPKESLLKLTDVVTIEERPKGYLLLESDKIEHSTYFISEGLVRAFQYQDENEVTFWFGKEGDPVLSMRSYIENKPGYENVELLEKSVLFKFNNSALHELYRKDIHIANWGRKLAEIQLLKTEENFISRQFKTASERYDKLLTTNPDLLQRVQLGHIASYLGITQVSLSRIRASK